MSFGGGSGGGGSIQTSSDVALNNPADGQALVYNSTLGKWQNTTISGGSGAVSSVAGRTGAVVLTASDVGLSNVNNTSDANKPISTATQTALNAKAAASTTVSGANSITGGGDLTANRTLQLSGDSATPGNNMYYGTNSGGTKGYYGLPSLTITLSALPAGSTFTIYRSGSNWVYNGATITSRPSARTDLTMIAISTDSTVPSFALSGVDIIMAVPS